MKWVLAPDAPGMEPQPGREPGRHPEHIWWRRQLAQDIAVWTLIAAAIALSGWVLWRVDDRSERLFEVVATERACVCR